MDDTNENEIDMEELKKLADSGNIDAKIEYAAICAENAIDIEKNLALLEEYAAKDNVRALMCVGRIYVLGVSKQSDGAAEWIIKPDTDKAGPYFLKAAELGDTYAAIMIGHQAGLKCRIWYHNQDDKDTEPAAADDFIFAEKWLRKGYDNREELDEELEYLVKLTAQMLSELYAMKCDINPIYDEAKSAEWAAIVKNLS